MKQCKVVIEDALSRSELQVMVLLADGHTIASAAAAIFRSVRTIESHTGTISRKLGSTHRGLWARWLMEQGILKPDITPEVAAKLEAARGKDGGVGR